MPITHKCDDTTLTHKLPRYALGTTTTGRLVDGTPEY